MQKYLLVRSVAIFSILVFLMMLTLGQLALSDTGTDIPDDGGVAKCGRLLIDKSFGNLIVRYKSSISVKSDGSQVCNETVYICRQFQERTTNTLIGSFVGNSIETDYCTGLTSQDFEDVPRDKLKAVFMRLASDESEKENGVHNSIQKQVLGLALEKKSEAAKELLKSYLYNQIWLGDGT